MIEIWKDIEGYENYQVSNLGNVKSLKWGKEKILSQHFNKQGYCKVWLYKDNDRKMHYVHRLVAQAFIPNPYNLPFINHRDENPCNNTLENLEWCTAEYNINYGLRTKRASEKHKIPILQFSKDGELIKKWNSAQDVMNELGYDDGGICKCLKGTQKTAYDSIWKYYDLDTYLIGKMNRNIKEKRMAC